ncbi:MAG: hypothetical protein HGGPFJEG_02204 [Ignavibacteria bacterium]|nr:hypothetical protein [Ignavibacteria bacterium]
MNKIKLILGIFILSSLFLSSANSQTRQGDYIASIEWSTALNVGRASDYISEFGWSGGALTFKKFVQNNVAVGLNFNYNIISKEDLDGVTELQNGTVSGPQARYLNYAPIYANLGYYFNKSKREKFIPYIQANVGTSYVWQRLQIGANEVDNDNWHFALGPEAGFIYKTGNGVGITFNAKYNYAFSSGEPLGTGDDNSYSFLNFNLGLSYIR